MGKEQQQQEQSKRTRGERSSLPARIPPAPITPQQILATSSALVLSGAVDIATHNPAVFLATAFGTWVVARHTNDAMALFARMIPGANAGEVGELATDIIDRVDPLEHLHPDQSTGAKLKRLLHLPTGAAPARPKQPKHDDVFDDEEAGEEEDDVTFELDEEEDIVRPHPQGLFRFSAILKDFTPSVTNIFLGRSAAGVNLSCHAKHLCHVAIAGQTGQGKSSIERMLMAQLCQAGVKVLLLNPHYTRYDIENDEDWTPFEPYLVHDPMECRKMAVIEHYLREIATTMIPHRLDRRALSQPVGKPYFIVIDELPSIIRKLEDAPEWMRTILEEGRKVGVFLISAAHNFLVKTISPKDGGGSIRDCYRTAYYLGGDATTAKELLGMPIKDLAENLGKGIVMLRGMPMPKAGLCYVPYLDNEALYALLGPSTYRSQVDDAIEDDLASPGSSSSANAANTRNVVDGGVAPAGRYQSQEHVYTAVHKLLTLYEDGKIDQATFERLIDAIPPQVDGEPHAAFLEEEEPIAATKGQRPAPIDMELERAILAYLDGATSINKLAAALDVKPYYAGPLLEKVKKEVQRRQQQVVNE